MIGIYKIANTENGKIYIGSSTCISRRFKQHIKCLKGGYHRNKYLQQSFNKHGIGCFKFTILEECNLENLLELETNYILKFNSFKREIGYNILIDASHSRLGVKHSLETKNKISLIQKGKKLSLDHKKIVVKNLINWSIFTDEQKESMREKKRIFSEQDKQNIIQLYKCGATQREITSKYNCSKTTTNKLFKELFESKILIKRKYGKTGV